MKKQKIKVIKRGSVPVTDLAAGLPLPEPTRSHKQRGLAVTVSDWITERRENREAEATRLSQQIDAWELNP